MAVHPANVNWGPLRVLNDDAIRPGRGFGSHPHRDMEIVTYVLEGISSTGIPRETGE